MKKKIAHIFYSCKVFFSLLRFRFAIASINEHDQVLFVDIDNTLADTWATLLQGGYVNDEDRTQRLPIFRYMRKWILNYQMKDIYVFFITARNSSLYNCTLDWLNKNQIPVSANQLYLVPMPQYKLSFISLVMYKTQQVTYIDDLTFGHEFGKVQLHQQLINELKKIKITYLGVDQIAAINNNVYGD